MIALPHLGSERRQDHGLLLMLDRLGDGGEAEPAGELDDPSGYAGAVGPVLQRLREATVDLEHVEGKELKPAQRRLAGAEVVEGDAHPGLLERSQGARSVVVEDGALRDLEHQAARVEPAALECGHDRVAELGIVELDRGG